MTEATSPHIGGLHPSVQEALQLERSNVLTDSPALNAAPMPEVRRDAVLNNMSLWSNLCLSQFGLFCR